MFILVKVIDAGIQSSCRFSFKEEFLGFSCLLDNSLVIRLLASQSKFFFYINKVLDLGLGVVVFDSKS